VHFNYLASWVKNHLSKGQLLHQRHSKVSKVSFRASQRVYEGNQWNASRVPKRKDEDLVPGKAVAKGTEEKN